MNVFIEYFLCTVDTLMLARIKCTRPCTVRTLVRVTRRLYYFIVEHFSAGIPETSIGAIFYMFMYSLFSGRQMQVCCSDYLKLQRYFVGTCGLHHYNKSLINNAHNSSHRNCLASS